MKKLISVVLALLLVGAGAWVVADRVESPNQVAARAEPPKPDPVVAPLVRGYLNGPISMSAVAQHEQTVTIKPPPTLTGVVTSVEKAVGDTLQSGSVLMRTNGRPLFVLIGAFALYRDIQPGDSGDDVQGIQVSLKDAGYSIGHDRAGVYGRGTQAAVRQMYKRAGYVAPEAPAVVAPEAPAVAVTDAGVNGGEADATPTSSSVEASAGVAGPRVLQTEVMMIASLPATVGSIAPVGAQVSSETDLVTLGAGQVVLSATLPNGSLGALTVGAAGAFTDDTGAEGAAEVTAVHPTEKGDATVVVLSSNSAVTPGSSYVLNVKNPAAEPGDSLLAPIAAVVARGGSSYVYARDGGLFREVNVDVTGSVGGVAAIVPVDSGVPLDAGTEVRIG